MHKDELKNIKWSIVATRGCESGQVKRWLYRWYRLPVSTTHHEDGGGGDGGGGSGGGCGCGGGGADSHNGVYFFSIVIGYLTNAHNFCIFWVNM